MAKKIASKMNTLRGVEDVSWLYSEHIRPYVYMREENIFKKPGTFLKSCQWFRETDKNFMTPLYFNPMEMSQVAFGDQILSLEAKAFHHSAMPMPRWVFYDCAIMPGLVCGFARRTSTLPKVFVERIGIRPELEWTPISLFIIIPTIREGEWVAHNLCTYNALVDEPDKHYALGFLTKAFGLWYANVEVLCGMTQWNSPARKLHSHYGPFQVLTAYTPVHSYARTITYSCRLDFNYWTSFFNYDQGVMGRGYQYAKFQVDPTNEVTIKALQARIEAGEGPFFLNPNEVRKADINDPIKVYLRKK